MCAVGFVFSMDETYPYKTVELKKNKVEYILKYVYLQNSSPESVDQHAGTPLPPSTEDHN